MLTKFNLLTKPKYNSIIKKSFSSNQLINSNFGLNQFIKKTYLWTGGAVSGSIGISILGAKVDFISSVFNSFGMFIGTGFGMSLIGITGIAFIKPEYHTSKQTNSKPSYFYTTNPVSRVLSYGSLVSGMGILMIPMFVAFPDAIIPAFIGSSSVFGGAVYYGLTKKQGEIKTWESTLYSGLSGLVGVSLLGLGSNLLLGQNMFGSAAHLISLYGGIPLFTGLIAYDTYKAIERYNEGIPDHLGCSVDLYLDFINVFVRLVEIIAKIQAITKNDDDDK
jgi:FtsH-binding integral membrane protein